MRSFFANLVPVLAIVGSLLLLVVVMVAVWQRENPQWAKIQPSGPSQEAVRPSDESPPQTAVQADEVPPEPRLPGAEPDSPTAPTRERPGTETGQEPEALSGEVPSDPAETIPEGPWQANLAADSDPTPLEELAFRRFDTAKALPTIQDLNNWLEPLRDQPHAVQVVSTSFGKIAGFRGLMKLRSPWPRNAAFRIGLTSVERFSLHLYHEQQGLSFVYYPGLRDQCAAYRTTRESGQALPATSTLVSTDGDRCRRTEMRPGACLMLRHEADELIVTRGDIEILRAPLPFDITEAFVEGGAALYGLEMARFAGRAVATSERPVVTTIDKPASLEWEQKLGDGAEFQKLPDGSVQLLANQAKQRGFVMAPLPSTGIHEYIFEVDEATVGGGVFCGTANGQPQVVIRFVQNTNDQQVCLSAHGNDDSRQAGLGTMRDRVVADAAPHLWIRLLYGCGALRWWMSVDGVHWAEPRESSNNLALEVTHFGLHHVAQQADCQITLRSLQIRRLDTIQQLVAGPLFELAVVNTKKQSYEQWVQAVTDARESVPAVPAETTDDQWLTACALKAIAVGCGRDLGQELLVQLLERTMRDPGLTFETKLAVLTEACLLLDLRDNNDWVLKHLARFHQLGRRAIASGVPGAFLRLDKALMTMPLHTRHNTYLIADPTLIQHELLHRIYERDFQQAAALSERIRFFGQHPKLKVLPWFEAMTAKGLDVPALAGLTPQQSSDWQHPLIEQLDKEAYNAMAELYALAAGGTPEEAATQIGAIPTEAFSGLAPTRDAMLMSGTAAAIQGLVTDDQEVAEAVVSEHGALADLRVREAIAQQNEPAVRLVARQFVGTPASVAAHRWLGDRALASGWFQHAIDQYWRALRTARPTRAADLRARLRLAYAMLGKDVGPSTTESVELADSRMSAADFESLVQDAVARNRQANTTLDQEASQETLPEPTEFEVQPRGRLDGQIGQSPNSQVTPETTQLKVDWAGEQISMTLDQEHVFVTNRFQIAAYRADDGSRLWQSEKLPGSLRRSRDWTLIRMRPLLTSRRIYARMLYGEGPSLGCWNKEDGKLIWASPMRRGYMLLSDPMMIQGQLLAIVGHRNEQSNWLVDLVEVNPQTGFFETEYRLLQLRPNWEARKCCEVTVVGDEFVASFGGVVLRSDARGQIRWLRKQELVPPSADPTWVQQSFQRPLLVDGKLYLAQPGVRVVECVDPDTGRLVWQSVLPDLRRVIGWTGGKLIVQTGNQLVALDAVDGTQKWQASANAFLVACLCDQRFVLAVTKQPSNKQRNKFKPKLVWFDCETGLAVGETVLDLFDSQDIWVGPMFARNGNLWLFSGQARAVENRVLMQLTPKPGK